MLDQRIDERADRLIERPARRPQQDSALLDDLNGPHRHPDGRAIPIPARLRIRARHPITSTAVRRVSISHVFHIYRSGRKGAIGTAVARKPTAPSRPHVERTLHHLT